MRDTQFITMENEYENDYRQKTFTNLTDALNSQPILSDSTQSNILPSINLKNKFTI